MPADAPPADGGRRPMHVQNLLSTRHAQLNAVYTLLIGDRRSATYSHDAPRPTRIGVFLAVPKTLASTAHALLSVLIAFEQRPLRHRARVGRDSRDSQLPS